MKILDFTKSLKWWARVLANWNVICFVSFQFFIQKRTNFPLLDLRLLFFWSLGISKCRKTLVISRWRLSRTLESVSWIVSLYDLALLMALRKSIPTVIGAPSIWEASSFVYSFVSDLLFFCLFCCCCLFFCLDLQNKSKKSRSRGV